jgi:signal transduction histidine kinase
MEEAEIQDYLGTLRDASVNLFRLLENLLQWARLKQGNIPFNSEILNFNSVAMECIALLQESAKTKNIEIVQDFKGQIMVHADNNVLQTILRNLISNAVKFTPKGGMVKITTQVSDEKSVKITVEDTGIGMSPEMISNLFSPGARTGRNGTDGEPSTGLGLLLCKEFIEKHGGKIHIESEEGKGSVFAFTLPVSN